MKVLGSFAAVILLFGAYISLGSTEDQIFGYECWTNKCVKIELSTENYDKAISLPVCRLFCGDDLGTVWPKPRGITLTEQYMAHINYRDIDFQLPNARQQAIAWYVNRKRFVQMLMAKIPNHDAKSGGNLLRVQVLDESAATSDDPMPKLTLETDESYRLSIAMTNDSEIIAKISATNFFGARHGLETLSQLIVFDDIRREVQILAKVDIQDSPAYKWRGLLLDTSRNFFSLRSIKRTLDAMAMVKLNTFHWHITDSHSFPLEVKSHPDLHTLGAYSPRKIYRHEDIIEVVKYARNRGIRIMPEFDAPSHVGEGWQHKNMTACFNVHPWQMYCSEPPCGQLDPTIDELYDVLEDIYREIFSLFEPEVFHMGGDEAYAECWAHSTKIRQWMTSQKWNLAKVDYYRLWGYFQANALKRVDIVANATKPLIVLWSSPLTDVPFIDDYLDKNRYIIQVWTTGIDKQMKVILQRGFHIVVSNYDALYFDCGGPGWVRGGTNWCSPYIGWQKVYENRLDVMVGKYKALVLGAEAAIWSEQIDELTLDARLWPRASAMAERLWSNPLGNWRQAEARIMLHRQRLVENNIGAEPLQPEWCLQNEKECQVEVNNPRYLET